MATDTECDSAIRDNAAGSECSTSEILLPEMPTEPLPGDCCGTGCTPCVFDIYEQEMAIWKEECERLRRGPCVSQDSEVCDCCIHWKKYLDQHGRISSVSDVLFVYQCPLVF